MCACARQRGSRALHVHTCLRRPVAAGCWFVVAGGAASEQVQSPNSDDEFQDHSRRSGSKNKGKPVYRASRYPTAPRKCFPDEGRAPLALCRCALWCRVLCLHLYEPRSSVQVCPVVSSSMPVPLHAVTPAPHVCRETPAPEHARDGECEQECGTRLASTRYTQSPVIWQQPHHTRQRQRQHQRRQHQQSVNQLLHHPPFSKSATNRDSRCVWHPSTSRYYSGFNNY